MARAEELGLGAVEDMDQLQGDRTRTGWAAAGSILGAIAASSCCILPLVLFSLGAGGAWIANLTALAPYQPIRSEEHTSELQSLMRISYAVFCLKKKTISKISAINRH